MDQKIKNFDRNIEQMMNENSVAPPFGMWNRISAELGSEALPIAAAAPASLMPKRAIVGFMAAAIILGVSLTAYLITTNSTEEKPIAAQLTTPQVTIQEQVIAEPQHLVVKAAPSAMAAKKTDALRQIVAETKKHEIVTAQYQPEITEVAVPNQLIAQNTLATDPYYFPPVDVVVQETNKVVEATVIEARLTPPAEAEIKMVEKKIRPTSSSSSDKRIKFKKKRSGSFTYGRLNRLKSPK